MSKNAMVITGHIPPPPAEALLASVRLDVVISRCEWLDASWSYELCSPFWRLYINRGAGAEVEFEGRTISLKRERCYLLPAGIRFRTHLRQGVDKLMQDYVHFQVEGFPPALLRRLFPGVVELAESDEVGRLVRAWRRGLQPVTPSTLVQRLWALALVHAAFAAACTRASDEGRSEWTRWLSLPPVIAPALRRIEESLAEPPSNAELAAACALGKRQFLRRFQDAVGLSPRQYALERRVALAAESLSRAEESIDSIAEKLGFSDRFHFSKMFRARVGVAPGAYRSLHAGQRSEPS